MITKKESIQALLELTTFAQQSGDTDRDILEIMGALAKIMKTHQEANNNLLQAITIIGKTVDHLTDVVSELKMKVDAFESFIDDLKLERQQ